MDTNQISVGDRIMFRAVTRSGARTQTRVVTGFFNSATSTPWPEVRAHGWTGFVVRPEEILAHAPPSSKE